MTAGPIARAVLDLTGTLHVHRAMAYTTTGAGRRDVAVGCKERHCSPMPKEARS